MSSSAYRERGNPAVADSVVDVENVTARLVRGRIWGEVAVPRPVFVCTDRENRGTMRNYRDTTQRQGQPQGRGRANMSMGRQLASLFGIDGLRHLSDDEVEQLVEIMRLLEAEGFRAGASEMSLYNADARLLNAPASTEH